MYTMEMVKDGLLAFEEDGEIESDDLAAAGIQVRRI